MPVGRPMPPLNLWERPMKGFCEELRHACPLPIKVRNHHMASGRIEDSGPAELDVQLIVDNYCTHKHANMPPTPPGSIRWSGGLGSSPTERSAEAAT